MTEPRTFANFYFDGYRFRLQMFLTRFDETIYFVMDAADITDAQREAGEQIEPCYQGDYIGAMGLIQRRAGKPWRDIDCHADRSVSAQF